MRWNSYGWRPYVSVAQRRANAARELNKITKKTGIPAAPVILEGRTIARTFWGRAWCDNLEAYSDFANRLPRGRTYVRNGSVVDLQIGQGRVTALVAGTELYRIEIQIKPLARARWKTIQTECAGQVDSLLELLQGRLSAGVMQIVTQPGRGLFPAPGEIDLDCSCPDWAGLCKHLAACLYGVGARLDEKPELLFVLRGVDPADLVSQASAEDAVRQSTRADGAPAMTDADLADVFGIELTSTPAPAVRTPDAQRPPPSQGSAPVVGPQGAPAYPEPAEPKRAKARAPKRKTQPRAKKPKRSYRRLTAATRARLAAVAKARWEKIKQEGRRAAPAAPTSKKKLSARARAK